MFQQAPPNKIIARLTGGDGSTDVAYSEVSLGVQVTPWQGCLEVV